MSFLFAKKTEPAFAFRFTQKVTYGIIYHNILYAEREKYEIRRCRSY